MSDVRDARTLFVPSRSRNSREALSRFERTHHQYGAAASGNAWRAARHPEARRRKSSRHRVRDRIPAPRRGKNRREPHLHDVQSLRRSHGLRRRGLEWTGLLRSGRETAECRGAAAREIYSRDPDRTEPHRQPPALAGHARARYRRDDAAVLHLPRPRRDSQDFRKILRRAPDHACFSHRRLPV